MSAWSFIRDEVFSVLENAIDHASLFTSDKTPDSRENDNRSKAPGFVYQAPTLLSKLTWVSPITIDAHRTMTSSAIWILRTGSHLLTS